MDSVNKYIAADKTAKDVTLDNHVMAAMHATGYKDASAKSIRSLRLVKASDIISTIADNLKRKLTQAQQNAEQLFVKRPTFATFLMGPGLMELFERVYIEYWLLDDNQDREEIAKEIHQQMQVQYPNGYQRGEKLTVAQISKYITMFSQRWLGGNKATYRHNQTEGKFSPPVVDHLQSRLADAIAEGEVGESKSERLAWYMGQDWEVPKQLKIEPKKKSAESAGEGGGSEEGEVMEEAEVMDGAEVIKRGKASQKRKVSVEGGASKLGPKSKQGKQLGEERRRQVLQDSDVVEGELMSGRALGVSAAKRRRV